MSLLIINTSAENDAETQIAINKLTEKADKYKVINTTEFNISHCIYIFEHIQKRRDNHITHIKKQ